MLDTRALPTRVFSWASSFGEPDPDLSKAHKWDVRVEKYLVDTLGATAWDETYGQTLGYRWRGEDTLTWGNPNEWVRINWLRNIIMGDAEMEALTLLSADLFSVMLKAQITRLEQIYSFRQDEAVKRFLEKNSAIVLLLLEAKSVRDHFFGTGIDISLEVVSDPEATNNSQLFGYIHTPGLPPDVALERINAMDEAWFLKKFEQTGGQFNFILA